jgi:hypothetical protein
MNKISEKVGVSIIKDGVWQKIAGKKDIDLFGKFLGVVVISGFVGVSALIVGIATKEEISEKRVDYPAKIVEVFPPKHFRVIVEYQNGKREKISISKHCNGMMQNLVGTNVTVTYRDTKFKDLVFGESNRHEAYIYGAKQKFCRG